MKTLLKNLGKTLAVASLVLLACISVQAQGLGDAPAAYCLVTPNTLITNTSPTYSTFAYTNSGLVQGKGYLVLCATNVGGTSPSLTCQLMSSPDAVTWTAQPITAVVYTNTAVAIASFEINQQNKYLQTTNLISGSTAQYYYSVSLLAGVKYK